MQSNVWIITILTNVLMVTSANGERPKRSLFFMKRTKANHFLYNINNAIRKNNMEILYLVPNYQLRRNFIPVPYINQNIYQESFPKLLIPSIMVMPSVINFKRPYITAFNERNYKTSYPNFNLSPDLEKMQRVTPVPNYNGVEVPLVRRNDGIAGKCRKNVNKDKAGKMSSALSKLKSPKFPKLTRNKEEISNDVNEQRVALTPYRNIIEIPTAVSPVTERKIQPIKSSTTYPLNLDQIKFSKDGTSSTTEIMAINTSTNFQELVVTSLDVTTSPSPPPLSVKKNVTLQSMFPPVDKKNEEINSSFTKTLTIPVDYMEPNDVSNNIKPQSHSENDVYKKVNSNKSNEDTVFKRENITFPKNIESQGELMSPPSIFNKFIDVLNNIDTVEGNVHNPPNINITQDTDDTFEKLGSYVMEVNNHSTDNPSNTDKPLDGSHQEGSQSQTNESKDFFSLFLPKDSDREISRGDVPDDMKR